MIRTMIVDDEVWVCKLICNIIKWEDFGYTVVKQAYNGNDALQAIKDLKPDLVFTDIRMPGLDGLELIKETKACGLTTKFVIISGYSDFGYAKTAIDSGVLGYLLKPVEPEDLSVLLEKLKTELAADHPSNQKQMLDEQLKKSRRQYREQFMYNYLITSPKLAPGFSLGQFNEEFGSAFESGNFQVFQIILDQKGTSSSDLNHIVLQSITEQWYEHMKPICFDACVIRTNMSVICITNYASAMEKQIRMLAEEVFHFCCERVPHIARYQVTLGIGDIVCSFRELPHSFLSAQNAVRARISLGTGQIIDLSESNSEPLCASEIFTERSRSLLTRFLNHAQSHSAQETVEEIFAELSRNNVHNHPGTVFQLAQLFLDALYSCLANINIDYGRNHPKKIAEQEIESMHSIAQLKQYLADLLGSAAMQTSPGRGKNTSVVEIMKAYIDEHYKEDISLKDLAARVYLNPKYVCELFKKETGVNFTDYLSFKRMEKAKLFLLDPRYRVADICGLVGYNDTKYFSKLFKRMIGVTPSQFRKLHC